MLHRPPGTEASTEGGSRGPPEGIEQEERRDLASHHTGKGSSSTMAAASVGANPTDSMRSLRLVTSPFSSYVHKIKHDNGRAQRPSQRPSPTRGRVSAVGEEEDEEGGKTVRVAPAPGPGLNPGLQTPDPRLQAPGSKLQAVGPGAQVPASSLQPPASSLQAPEAAEVDEDGELHSLEHTKHARAGAGARTDLASLLSKRAEAARAKRALSRPKVWDGLV